VTELSGRLRRLRERVSDRDRLVSGKPFVVTLLDSKLRDRVGDPRDDDPFRFVRPPVSGGGAA
jgi:hypothetical protein